MKNLKSFLTLFIATLLMTSSAQAGMHWFDSSGASLGIFSEGKCSTGMTCTVVAGKLNVVSSPSVTGPLSVSGATTGDGTGALTGFLSKIIAATATTITAAQCGGTFINSGAVVINLPEASTAVGCTLTFITANASNFDVNPDDGDQILVLTNATGDAIRNATLGNSVTLRAINGSQWAPVGKEQGTWSDIN